MPGMDVNFCQITDALHQHHNIIPRGPQLVWQKQNHLQKLTGHLHTCIFVGMSVHLPESFHFHKTLPSKVIDC